MQVQVHTMELGALMKIGGNRESGENPERSRHCNGGALFFCFSPLDENRGRPKERVDP
jgi:hypothetical protein